MCYYLACTPRRSRGMAARWSRCDIAATVDHAHAASVKSVASGFWPDAGPTRAVSVPGRSAPASSSRLHSDLPAFATAGMDGATRVWRLARRDESFGSDAIPSGGSEAARAPFAATRVASVESHGGHGAKNRAVAMARTARPAVAALATGSYDGAATIRAFGTNADQILSAETEPSTVTYEHRESVLSLAFSPDGKFLVTGSADGVARVWSARETFFADDESLKTPTTQKPAKTAPLALLAIPGFGAVWCVDTAPANESCFPSPHCAEDLVATGGEDGTIRVWSWSASSEKHSIGDFAGDGEVKNHLTCELMLKGHARGVTAMALCPARNDKNKNKDGSFVRDGKGHNSKAEVCEGGVSFRVAAGGDAGAVAAWSFALADASETRAPTTTRLAFGRAHARGGVRATVFLTVEADVLASASEDKTVRLWDLQTGSCLCALVGARAAAESVAFSRDAAFLFAGVADGSFAAWRDASGESEHGASRGDVAMSQVERASDGDTRVVQLLEARVTLGTRTLLSPPPDFAEAAASEARSGAVGVDAACVASADASAREDAEAFLPRVDTNSIARLVLRASSVREGTPEEEAVPCAICRAPARFSLGEKKNKKRTLAREDIGDWCMPLPCGHAFHARACILPWLTRGETTCPLCRRRVVEAGGEEPTACLWTTRST